MSSCCKGNPNSNNNQSPITSGEKEKINKKSIVKYGLKFLFFLLIMVFTPLIYLAICWFVFRTIVLSKEVDIKPLLIAISDKFKVKYEDDYDDEYYELTEEDVEMLDVDVISNNTKDSTKL